MPLEDLEEHGVLLSEEERGTHPSASLTAKTPVLVASALAVAGCIAMFLGNGRLWTWIGLGAFSVGFFTIIVLSDRAVSARRDQVEQIRAELGIEREHGPEDGDSP